MAYLNPLEKKKKKRKQKNVRLKSFPPANCCHFKRPDEFPFATPDGGAEALVSASAAPPPPARHDHAARRSLRRRPHDPHDHNFRVGGVRGEKREGGRKKRWGRGLSSNFPFLIALYPPVPPESFSFSSPLSFCYLGSFFTLLPLASSAPLPTSHLSTLPSVPSPFSPSPSYFPIPSTYPFPLLRPSPFTLYPRPHPHPRERPWGRKAKKGGRAGCGCGSSLCQHGPLCSLFYRP